MEQLEILKRLSTILENHFLKQRHGRFLRYKDPAELRKILRLEDPAEGDGWPAIFQWIEKYLEYSVKTNHPTFVNRMWAGANLPSILGEMVAAISNTSSCTYESAPVSTLMEKYMIGEMLRLVGFTNGEGQMTTGSSNANMLAMMTARNEMLPTVKTEGMYGQKDIHGFISADAHYSLEKAANVLGLGTDRLRKVAVRHTGEMDTDDLERQLREVTERGGLPFFVCATAGTTVRGAYDQLEEILDLRDRYLFWLHVDGAWGGAVVVSDILKDKYLRGIDRVDSFTWDFHKMLGTALMCNVFLINHRRHTLGRVCSVGDSSYVFHDGGDDEVLDLGAVSLQCGRRVDSLKWFLDWKFFGKKGFAARVERCLELCRYAEKIVLEAEELELVLPRVSFNVCFRYTTAGKQANRLNLALRTQLYHQGSSLVGYAYHGKTLFLRLLLANHDMTEKDVDGYFSQLIATGKHLERGLP